MIVNTCLENTTPFSAFCIWSRESEFEYLVLGRYDFKVFIFYFLN